LSHEAPRRRLVGVGGLGADAARAARAPICADRLRGRLRHLDAGLAHALHAGRSQQVLRVVEVRLDVHGQQLDRGPQARARRS
jgi:hypothetical protein